MAPPERVAPDGTRFTFWQPLSAMLSSDYKHEISPFVLRVPGVAGDYDVQMAENPGGGQAGEARTRGASKGRRGLGGRHRGRALFSPAPVV